MGEYYPEHPIESFRVKKSGQMGPFISVSPIDAIDTENFKQSGILNSPAGFEKLNLQEKGDIFGSKLLYYTGSHLIQVDKMQKESEKLQGEVIKFLDYLNVQGILKNMDLFSFEKGICMMEIQAPPSVNNKKISLNLARLFTQNGLDIREWGRAMNVKEDLLKLRTSLETESLFGGAILISYEQKEGAKRLLGGTLGALSVAGGLSTTEYLVRKMLFRDETGKMQEVDPKIVKNILKGVGDKTRINSLIFKIMRGADRVYNPIRNAFTDMATLAIDQSLTKLKGLKKSDIPGSENISEKEFDIEKQKAVSILSKMSKQDMIVFSGKIAKSIPGATFQGIIYSTFFEDYHKYSYDTAQFYRGFAEAGLFEVGSYVGRKLTPGVWKVPGALIGGGLAIVGGTMAGGALNLDKKVWRTLPDRMSGDGSKSFIVHAVSGGTVFDIADDTGVDMGVPGTRGGAVIYNPFGKDGIMPNVDFAGTNITFGTDPREYLQSRVLSSDTHWNKRMDEYISWATDLSMKVLYEYDHNRGYFTASNGQKEDLLRERLRHIFDSEDGKNKRNNQIIEDCIDYIVKSLTKIKDLNSRKELLSTFLSNYGNILKIDKASLEYDKKLLERDKIIIDSQVEMYKSLLPQEKRQLIDNILSRLQSGDRLLAGKIVVKQAGRGRLMNTWQTDKKENELYRELIDDPTPVREEWFNILGYKVEELNFQKSIKIPKSIVQLSGKNIYLDMGVSFLANDYRVAFDKKDRVKISELDKQSGLAISKEFEKNPLMFQKNPFVGILGEYFLLERLSGVNPSIKDVLVKANNKSRPTLGDVFVYLLNIHTGHREQKRFIDTQEQIGYANKWKF